MAGIKKSSALDITGIVFMMICGFLLLTFPANSNAQTQDSDVSELTLNVAPYVSVTFDDDVIMTNITAAMFVAGSAASTGQIGMSIAANTGAVIHVPMVATLTRNGPGVQPTIEVDLDISMVGWVTSPTPVMVGPLWFWEATIDSGWYDSAIFQAEISPPQPINPATLWAGIYQGTATVTITAI
jgi:hypothetical protein